jgi:hypothetical protein
LFQNKPKRDYVSVVRCPVEHSAIRKFIRASLPWASPVLAMT